MKLSREYYEREYIVNERSMRDIAAEQATYISKIRRDLVLYNIEIRDKSEAQRVALKHGRHKHPTKGKVRSPEVRRKIGTRLAETKHNAKNRKKRRNNNQRNSHTAENN